MVDHIPPLYGLFRSYAVSYYIVIEFGHMQGFPFRSSNAIYLAALLSMSLYDLTGARIALLMPQPDLPLLRSVSTGQGRERERETENDGSFPAAFALLRLLLSFFDFISLTPGSCSSPTAIPASSPKGMSAYQARPSKSLVFIPAILSLQIQISDLHLRATPRSLALSCSLHLRHSANAVTVLGPCMVGGKMPSGKCFMELWEIVLHATAALVQIRDPNCLRSIDADFEQEKSIRLQINRVCGEKFLHPLF